MHPNSLYLYHAEILTTLKDRHKRVFNAIVALGNATSYEIADYLNVPVHTLSGRISELSGNAKSNSYDKPVIVEVGTRLNKYNNKCAVYGIKFYAKEGEQAKLF